MPTENRRVAAYLPKGIDEKFEAFKHERGLKGDSPALLTILSEFFGVAQQVAYQSSSDLVQRLERIESRLPQLRGELLSELENRLSKFESSIDSRLNDLEAKLASAHQSKVDVKDELLSELLSELPRHSTYSEVVPGQLVLLDGHGEAETQDKSISEIGDISSELLSGLSATKLAKRFGKSKGTVLRRRGNSDFQDWTRGEDPDGIAWEYREDSEKFYPSL